MSRYLIVVGTAVLLIAMAGCTFDTVYLTVTGCGIHEELAVAGNVSAATSLLNKKLLDMGAHAVITNDGEEQHIRGETRAGYTFDFVLRTLKSDKGEQTLIAIDGEKTFTASLWNEAVLKVFVPSPQPIATVAH